jgi:hypothetical protein
MVVPFVALFELYAVLREQSDSAPDQAFGLEEAAVHLREAIARAARVGLIREVATSAGDCLAKDVVVTTVDRDYSAELGAEVLLQAEDIYFRRASGKYVAEVGMADLAEAVLPHHVVS